MAGPQPWEVIVWIMLVVITGVNVYLWFDHRRIGTRVKDELNRRYGRD